MSALFEKDLEEKPSLYKVSFKVHLVENYASYQSLSKKNLDIQT